MKSKYNNYERQQPSHSGSGLSKFVNFILFLSGIFTTWGLVLVATTPDINGDRMLAIFAMLFCVAMSWGMLAISIRKNLHWQWGDDIGDD